MNTDTVSVKTYMPQSFRDKLKAAARKEGKSLSAYLLDCALKKANIIHT